MIYPLLTPMPGPFGFCMQQRILKDHIVQGSGEFFNVYVMPV